MTATIRRPVWRGKLLCLLLPMLLLLLSLPLLLLLLSLLLLPMLLLLPILLIAAVAGSCIAQS